MNNSIFTIPLPPTVQVTAALESVRNILLSLWALTAEEPTGVDSRLNQIAQQLSAEQRSFNQLLFVAFGLALLPEESQPTFANYLDGLAQKPNEAFDNRLTQAAQSITDPILRAEVDALLVDRQLLQQKIVEHLRILWEGWLAAEWKRHTPMLTGMTTSINDMIFRQPGWQEVTATAALRFLLQTEPTDQQLAQLPGVKRIVLVWSPHLLTYCNRFGSSDTLWVVRKFDPQLMRRAPFNRAEIVGPLSTLADETRLRILELLTENGEQRTQEIIAQLEGSQGNVSRHLKQLVGAGFVRERRVGDANKHYEYDAAGLQRLIFLLRQLLSSRNAQWVRQQLQSEVQLEQVRASAPELLHGFLDKQGRITRWSSKQKDQQAIMEYLIGKFEVERGYSEKQVNELLQTWYLDADFVLVRRELIDRQLLKRTKDGARYWREA